MQISPVYSYQAGPKTEGNLPKSINIHGHLERHVNPITGKQTLLFSQH